MTRAHLTVVDPLSDKLSEAILQALEDLSFCEQDDHYVIEMAEWLKTNGQCQVCFAGAVMARRLDGERLVREKEIPNWEDHPDSFYPCDVQRSLQNKLSALNEVRGGNLYGAMCNWTGVWPKAAHSIPTWVEVVSYRSDPETWKEQMKEIAVMLAEAGF